ncbi:MULTISPECIES: hypothetical protein [unclassified Rhodococcus (in: high G+C Gram-positive bacteria)]
MISAGITVPTDARAHRRNPATDEIGLDPRRLPIWTAMGLCDSMLRLSIPAPRYPFVTFVINLLSNGLQDGDFLASCLPQHDLQRGVGMNYATLDEDSQSMTLIPQVHHRLVLGSSFGAIVAAAIALSVGGHAITLMIGALVLGIVGLLAATL